MQNITIYHKVSVRQYSVLGTEYTAVNKLKSSLWSLDLHCGGEQSINI